MIAALMTDLHDLIRLPYVWDRLAEVEERLLEAATSDDPYLTKIAQHLLLAGGKRFRPLLALLAAEFGTSARDRRPGRGGGFGRAHPCRQPLPRRRDRRIRCSPGGTVGQCQLDQHCGDPGRATF